MRWRISPVLTGPLVTVLGGMAVVLGALLPWSATPFDDGITQYWTVFDLHRYDPHWSGVPPVVAVLCLICGVVLIGIGCLRAVRPRIGARWIIVVLGAATFGVATWSIFPIIALWHTHLHMPQTGIEPISYGLIVTMCGGIYAVLGGLLDSDNESS